MIGTFRSPHLPKVGAVLLGLAALVAPLPVSAQSSASAFTSATRYDAMHRVTGTIAPDPDGAGPLHYAAVRNTYDGAGRLVKVEKAELLSWPAEDVPPSAWTNVTIFQTLATVYDSQSRKVRETLTGSDGAQTLTQYSYDALGNLECTAVRMNSAVYGALPASACTQSTNGANGPDRITRNIYDAAGQLIQVREGVGTSIEGTQATYSYTVTGKREYIVDGNGNLARLGYDGHDRLSQWTFPSTTRPTAFNDSTPADALSSAGSLNGADFEQYGYDLNGNRTSLRKRGGQVLGFAYDALNRMVHKGGPIADVDYTYDAQGHQLTAKFSTGGEGIANAYNGFGELASTTSTMGGTARTLSYLYDADGNRTRVTHPDGQAFTYAYDGLDRLSGVYQGVGTAAPLETFAYAANSLLSSRGESAGASSAGYGYDGIGRLTSQSDAFAGGGGNVTWTLGFNPASQITQETRSNNSYAWTGAVAVNRNYVTNGLNQYTTAGPASFTYDANGNLTSDGTNSYVYDAENRLISATAGGVTTTLSYDPLGRLWRVVKGTSDTRFLYDGDALIAEYNGANTLLNRYVHGSDAAADDPLVWYIGGGLTSRRMLHADHLGSIVALADASGILANFNTYDEYGIPGANNAGRFQYTGQAWIGEIGMYYYKARIYSPTLGRFLQTDPVGYEGGINLYAYVEDDPVNHTDPTGEVIDTILDVGFLIYDGYKIATEGATAENVAAFGADAVATVIPGVTGAGMVVRAGAHASEAARAAARATEGVSNSRRFSSADRATLHNRAGGNCEYCGKKLTMQPGKPNSMHADHMTAHANGGKTNLNNGAAACAQCNLSKGAKTLSNSPGPGKFVPPNPNPRIKDALDKEIMQ